jgi:rhamnogalacturonyl hydrolase YesR
VPQARFLVELDGREYAVVEHEGKGVELVSGLVPVRVLDKAMLRRRIDEGKAYLLRMIDPELGGVHKYYDAPTDTFENRLHTIYTASTIYTLLAVYAHDQDENLREPIDRAADFLLSMQRIAPDEPGHGAFHHSLDLQLHEREPRFVVGTTAKSIFSLIELHALSGEEVYLDAARTAADWLSTMQDVDGRVWSELRMDSNGYWYVTWQESMLYTGQVLSALSRLYAATADAKYLQAATLTAGHLAAKVESEGCYVGDDYRSPNPISSSWVILSLFDFARASGDPQILETVFECADELLEMQIDDPDDVYRHGRWRDSLSSSGSGWLAEVLSELYLDCPNGDAEGCARYHRAVVLLFRLLMQYTYSPENAFVAKNPEMARGGVFWDAFNREVRTDSVCHAMNAYVSMIDHMPDGVLVELPEPPLTERLIGAW